MRLILLFLLLASAPVAAKTKTRRPPTTDPRAPAPDCNRTASCQCSDPRWDRKTPCDPSPH